MDDRPDVFGFCDDNASSEVQFMEEMDDRRIMVL